LIFQINNGPKVLYSVSEKSDPRERALKVMSKNIEDLRSKLPDNCTELKTLYLNFLNGPFSCDFDLKGQSHEID